MSRAAVIVAALGLALAACGDDEREEPARAPTPAPAPAATVLEITTDEDGTGAARPRSATLRCPQQARACALLDPAALEPLPRDVACTEIFGGPETATIRGTLDGRRVDARFSRTNGCEIDRYDRIEPLLDAVL